MAPKALALAWHMPRTARAGPHARPGAAFARRILTVTPMSLNTTAKQMCSRSQSSGLLESVLELPVGDRNLDALHLSALEHPAQELLADGRQHGVGQDRVDHAPTALELGA